MALVGAGAAAETLNTTYGDCIDPAHAIAATQKFLSSGIDLKCRSCGWRKTGTKLCTMRAVNTGDGETCVEFRHVFNVVDK